MKDAMDIMQLVNDEDVEFIRLQFTDIFGNLKNLAVTRSQIPKILSNKYRISSSALFDGYMPREMDEELYLFPILDSFTILPWRPQQGKVGKFLCDVCYADGTLYEESSRTILKKVVDKAAAKGYTFLIHPECEFFLFHTDDNGLPTTLTHEQAGYMDVGPVDFGENARREMVLSLSEMGFDIESSHHELAPAQHEIDFRATETMNAADLLMTFKFAVRSIAKRFGLYATFMPKPKENVAGSGMHLSIGLLKNGINVVDINKDADEFESDGKSFVAGILKHAKAMCLYTNPLINSYKRIITGFDAPRIIGWSKKGQDAIVKIRREESDSRIEIRFPDSAANPYLALAVIIAAGLDGIDNKLELGSEYRPGDAAEILPENISEAIKEFDKDDVINSVAGEKFTAIFKGAKLDAWNSYMSRVSDWELERYLYKL